MKFSKMPQTETIFIGDKTLKRNTKNVCGEIVSIDNEKFYKISNYDLMPPFLMNIVSESDLWMFISSNGALTAGRKNPDNALFPYYTDDRIHDSKNITGSKTVIYINKDGKLFLWEPFTSGCYDIYDTERTLYKSISGNKLIFEEVNFDLSVGFQYSWMNCNRFGFIKKAKVENKNNDAVYIQILDGIQNILPFGADRKFQLEYSTLLDGYKKNELIDGTGLALYTLSSIPLDKAEPNEALRATLVWSAGLYEERILLSSEQVCSFKQGKSIDTENIVKAKRGSYFLQTDFELAEGKNKEWYIVADVSKDQSDIAAISAFISSCQDLEQQIENEVLNNTAELNSKIASADGFQLTNDELNSFRHYSNVTFNIMRGGIFDNNYLIYKNDFSSFIKTANFQLWQNYKIFLEELPDHINIADLTAAAEKSGNKNLLKLSYEYLPLTFSRRHGDPSRPWNIFSIDIKDEDENKILNYQGNWRDIFQNWEALAVSYPGFIENMIVKFVNASTADGYNPYKVTRDGFDWEVLDPSDAWSYIGYWGDHQVIYLLKLLELSSKYHPEKLKSFLTEEIFAYANVPYKIKSYQKIVEDPHNTIDFNFELDAEIKKRVREIGEDGKYIPDNNGEIYRVSLTEKLLVIILVKISNFIPGAGIWLNTQRPEWNDANNALVGYGTSMVTVYYLRRFINFISKLVSEAGFERVEISEEVVELFSGINNILIEFKDLLKNEISDNDRKRILDGLGEAGSIHRSQIYSKGFSGIKKKIKVYQIISFLKLVSEYIDHTIRYNKREDDLYHSYNLVRFNNQSGICIRHLYEMLEGQVAVLSSGFLSIDDSIFLISSLKKSRLYRKDQNSYLLYPDRELPRFIQKNVIPDELWKQSEFLCEMVNKGDKRIVIKDINGKIHFNSSFRNSTLLKKVLNDQDNNLASEEKQLILGIYESVFDHQSFTGRSGTFFKYEGLGSIYWHMVSKLLLAVQEVYLRASEEKSNSSDLRKLKNYYYDIREGIGSHKTPEQYGAFPTDPYSHTPGNMGVQQPGMTGQVKEDIISRFGELGVIIQNGKIKFNTGLINKNEFLTRSQVYKYYDVNNIQQTLILSSGMLAFSVCQVPVVYILSDVEKMIVSWNNGVEEEVNGIELNESLSEMIFLRNGKITKVKVLFNKLNF